MDGHYICPIEKTNKNEEWRLTQSQIGWSEKTLQNSFWEPIRTCRASANVKPLDSSLYPPPTTSTGESSSSSSASSAGSVPQMTSLLNSSKVLRTHSTPFLSVTSKPRTNRGSGDTRLPTTPSSISNTPSSEISSANWEVLLTFFFFGWTHYFEYWMTWLMSYYIVDSHFYS